MHHLQSADSNKRSAGAEASHRVHAAISPRTNYTRDSNYTPHADYTLRANYTSRADRVSLQRVLPSSVTACYTLAVVALIIPVICV